MNAKSLFRRCLLLAVLSSAFSTLAYSSPSHDSTGGGTVLVSGGKAVGRIVVADTAAYGAASLLNYFVRQLSGVELPVAGSNDGRPRRGDIIIGEKPVAPVGTDGYAYRCSGGTAHVGALTGRGAALGMARLLERFFHVNYLAKDAWSITTGDGTTIANDQWQPLRRATLEMPAGEWSWTPAFSYRQTFGYSNADTLYNAWFGFGQPSDIFAGNMWVHTANQILPASRYGTAHPEWYSMINGRRQPGDHSQWCLTNEELFRQVCHNLDSIFARYPGKTMISVSQNDGNNTNCHCAECLRVEQEEGSPSGPIIRFLNRLAARYPDKQFSTLAYLFSMQPPRKVRPLPNVNIMLCSIDSRREVPLTDNASGQEFTKALEGWARLTGNIFVWDYGINFDNFVSPFPNFHVLAPNIRLFHRNGVRMLFEQANGNLGTDFAELREWMTGKLMLDPSQDADSLMQVFLQGYYGSAAPYIYSYRKMMEGALLASRVPLWIYDSPISHKDGMLNDNLMKSYAALFDKAEAAVEDRPELLRRVRIARLPLQYSWLEIARTRRGTDTGEVLSRLQAFRDRCEEYGVASLNERNNSPLDYCDLYRQRYLPPATPSKALGAKVTYAKPPSERYRAIAATALTDGLYGGMGYVEGWVGWEGTDADLTLDLGEEKTVSRLSADFLHQIGAWVLLPRSVSYEVSADGTAWQPFGATCTFAEDRSPSVKFRQAVAEAPAVSVRYIRVVVRGVGMCPPWHYGVGYPAWFFMDEIRVD